MLTASSYCPIKMDTNADTRRSKIRGFCETIVQHFWEFLASIQSGVEQMEFKWVTQSLSQRAVQLNRGSLLDTLINRAELVSWQFVIDWSRSLPEIVPNTCWVTIPVLEHRNHWARTDEASDWHQTSWAPYWDRRVRAREQPEASREIKIAGANTSSICVHSSSSSPGDDPRRFRARSWVLLNN